MAEKLEIYDLSGRFIGIKDRAKFYKEIESEFQKKGKITKKVKSIRLILLNSSGKIYVQIRSDEKERNPGLYDKSIGGHLKVGHSWDLTVVKECHEELGFPTVVLDNDEFREAIHTTDLRIIALTRKLEHIETFLSINNNKGKKIEQPFITTMYLCYFDGPINFCDGEAHGIHSFKIDKLIEKIEESPELFTEDLKFMIERYKEYLIPIADIKQKKVKGF
tara:strand:+ start:169 stop:828 length:660 start_codon:yes stop_codon:yes gene_type:complete